MMSQIRSVQRYITYHFLYSNRVVNDFAACVEGVCVCVWFFLVLFSLPQSLRILAAAQSATISVSCFLRTREGSLRIYPSAAKKQKQGKLVHFSFYMLTH